MKKKKEEKQSKKLDNIFTIILVIGDVIAVTILFLLYGTYPNFRNWLVTTAMTTMNHQYLATTFYSEERIFARLVRPNLQSKAIYAFKGRLFSL